jgi:23S rRNA (adenine1618-N6)-methyltransferase
VARWDIPDGYLCPPIPGRADYIHHLADLLASDRGGVVPRGPDVAVLDIGMGANCIYPIVGTHEYGWRFVGSETDTVALSNARRIVADNPALARRIECRRQRTPMAVFRGIVQTGERFDLTLCNPPFHLSRAEALAGTQRKLKNLSGGRREPAVLNFGGQATELWCEGGELGFIRRMIVESVAVAENCLWFTTMVSKAANLSPIERALARAQAVEVRTIPMQQGQKRSRIVAWTFRRPDARRRG